MFFLAVTTFYVLGDILIDAYTVSRAALWILVGLSIVEIYGGYKKRMSNG